MDHQRIYNQIIDRAVARTLPAEVYVERHHIVPRCVGGSNDASNIVSLTGREHFLCHWLLCRANPKNKRLAIAFDWMTKKHYPARSHRTPSSRVIAEARELSSKARKGVKRPSVSIKLRGRLVSEETKLKRHQTKLRTGAYERSRQRNTGRGNPMFGRKRPDWALLNTLTKSRKCMVDGREYVSVRAAARELGMPHKTLLNRIHSEAFPSCMFA